MKDIKKLLCDEMHKFVKEHIDEVENKKADIKEVRPTKKSIVVYEWEEVK